MTTTQFYKLLAWVNCAVPGAMLALDAYGGNLGANSVNDAIRTTGLIALTLLTLSLAVTPLRRVTGWNALISVRRALGVSGFVYACLHLVLYVGLDRALDLRSALEELFMRRYLQIGLVAILLMLPLAITSTDAMVRRLGAKRWKLLHRLAYLAIAAGVLHYYLLVKSDVRQPLAFAGVLGGLLVFRGADGVLALRSAASRSKLSASKATARRTPSAGGATAPAAKREFYRGELTVAALFDETPEVRTFRLVAPGGGPLPFTYKPGQFLTLQQQVDGDRITRCYTIASTPTRTAYCEITVKRELHGVSSRNLHDHVRVGDRLKIGAPAGKFVFDGRGADRVVLIAGGVGITPLMAITRYLTDTCWSGRIDFILAARSRSGIIFHDELNLLASRFPNLRLHIVLSNADDDPQWNGARGHLSKDLLENWVDDWRTPSIFLCGPKPMMDAVTKLLQETGAPAGHIFTEAFVSSAALEKLNPPAQGQNSAPSGAPAEAPVEANIRFTKSQVETAVVPPQTVLEAAEEAGLDLPFECRSGICGQCKIALGRGSVKMDVEDAITAAEKRAGLILACQAHPLEDLEIEA